MLPSMCSCIIGGSLTSSRASSPPGGCMAGAGAIWCICGLCIDPPPCAKASGAARKPASTAGAMILNIILSLGFGSQFSPWRPGGRMIAVTIISLTHQ